VRAKITETLKEKGEAMTAEEIFHAIKVRSVSNAKALSNSIKGMKNIKVIRKGFTVKSGTDQYSVNTYIYEDNEGAEI